MGPGPAAGFTATSTARALLLVAALAGMVAFAPPPAVRTIPALAAAIDITGQILADQNVTLDGDSVITLPGGTSTYTGVISGAGTLIVSGTGTLVLTKDSDFTIPPARHTEQVSNGGGNWPYATITNPDPPAITVNRGAALQYGTGGGTGVIGHFPYHASGFALNALNIRVDGTLTVNVTKRVHLGIMSGSGFIVQPRSTWPGLDLAGAHPFSGVLYNGTGMQFASPDYPTALPNVRKILNQGSFIVDTPMNQRTVVSADLYNREWGSDVNLHSRGTGVVVMTGVYSWANAGADSDPSLSDPTLNFTAQPHRANKRGINIEGADVRWGDGSTNRFFLPGTRDTLYINMHAARNRSRLTFDYNGPVTLGATISGGQFNDTLADVGHGDVVIAPTHGNDVTFAAPQNYDGSTTIGGGATLRLGSGTVDGDGSLLSSTPLYQVADNGALIVQNTRTTIALSRISGSGSFTQAGAATTNFTGQTSYTGPTVISAGTLAVKAGDISSSSAVSLTAGGAKLDLSSVGDQTVNDLSGVAGTTVALGAGTLTVGTSGSTTFGGSITSSGGGVTKVGTGTWTLTGSSTTPGGTWHVRQGDVRLGNPDGTGAHASLQGTVDVAPGSTLSGSGSVDGSVSNAGTLAPGPAVLQLSGGYTQQAGGTLVASPSGSKGLSVAGPVKVAGRLHVADGAIPADVKQLTLLDNQGSAPVSGTFDGLPEGADLTVAGTTCQISYRGGDGNDVVLTVSEQAAGGDAASGTVSGSGGSVFSPLVFAAAAAGVLLVAAGAVALVLARRHRSRRQRLRT